MATNKPTTSKVGNAPEDEEISEAERLSSQLCDIGCRLSGMSAILCDLTNERGIGDICWLMSDIANAMNHELGDIAMRVQHMETSVAVESTSNRQ